MAHISTGIMKCTCLFLLLTSFANAGFLETFCASRCNIGRGGNLCKCNGFHFAGKRTSSPEQFADNIQKAKYNYYNGIDTDLDTKDFESPYFGDNLEDSYTRNEDSRIENVKRFISWLMHKVEKNRRKNRGSEFNDYDTRGAV